MLVLETYQSLKSQNPDTVLFMQLGDFYEAFDADAEIVAKETGLTLHTVGASDVKMAGAPCSTIDGYVAQLLKKGYHVAMAKREGRAGGEMAVKGERT